MQGRLWFGSCLQDIIYSQFHCALYIFEIHINISHIITMLKVT